MSNGKVLLVGDNPFQGVSHLSQDRVMARGNDLSNPDYCAGLVAISVKNGADGFMFTANDKTLAILKAIPKEGNGMMLYPLVPDASGLVRVAGRKGGFLGLARGLAGGAVSSGGLKMVAGGVVGVVAANPQTLFKTYLRYEIARVKSAMGKRMALASVLLHEIVTDMALALNMKWLFEAYIECISGFGIKIGFETRNFPYLVGKFREWGIGMNGMVIATPFNKLGFQMCPSREENEKVLSMVDGAEVIAFSVLAAGYLKLGDAVKYIDNLPNIGGIAIGVSNDKQACETFRFLRAELESD